MTTTKTKHGRPARRSKGRRDPNISGSGQIRKSSKKVESSAREIYPGPDRDLLKTIGTPAAGAADSSPKIGEISLTVPAAADAAAADETDNQQAAGDKSKQRNKISDDMRLPPEAAAFLEPGVVTDLVVMGFQRVPRDSRWSTTDKEARDIGKALERVLDKYFPGGGEWSPEATLIAVMLLYTVPRVVGVYRDRKAQAVSRSGMTPGLSRTEKPLDAGGGIAHF